MLLDLGMSIGLGGQMQCMTMISVQLSECMIRYVHIRSFTDDHRFLGSSTMSSSLCHVLTALDIRALAHDETTAYTVLEEQYARNNICRHVPAEIAHARLSAAL